MNRHYISLELPKILNKLSEFTTCDDARYNAQNLKPECNLNLAQASLNQTVDAHMLMARFGAPSFGSLKNVNGSLSRANAGSTLSMRELLDIAEVLRVIRSLSEWRKNHSSLDNALDNYFDALSPNKFLEEQITSAIISDDEMSDNASSTLRDIRRKIRVASSKVREILDKMTRSTHYQKFLRDSIVTMRNGRYVVPVKIEFRGEVKGLVHDTSSTGSTVFIEPAAVVEANNDIKVLQSKERDEIEKILTDLSMQAGEFYESIKYSYECCVELNVIFAKAKLAYEMKASAPELNDEGIIELKNARHPLIDKHQVVANNISLGIDFDTLVITGSNTGGKTVSIKTLGLLSLMCMCGLMIPVSDQSKISVFEHVLADIGDEQSIEQSLSTFSSHMTNIIDIVNTANDKSLVLIDELGVGTDPSEGAAIAMSIIEHMHLNGAKIAATTHYSELKLFAQKTDRVINASCEFDVESLRPTYRLMIGIPGKSHALAISSRLGMSDEIVQRAKSLLNSDNAELEDVIESLQRSRQEYENEKERTEKIKFDALKEKKKAQEYKDEIEKLKKREMEKAQAEATRVVDQAKRAAYSLVNELEEMKKESAKAKDKNEMARRAKQMMRKGMQEFDDITNPVVRSALLEEDYTLPRPLKIGDDVIIADIDTNAVVTALADKKGRIEVTAGIIKMKTPEKNLRLIQTAPKKETKQKVKARATESVFTPKDATENRCDLRGMSVEEGIMAVDLSIDRCMRIGLGELTVIHGKGTGVLRKGIHEFLRRHSCVKAFRLGVYGEGENGVTIVTIK